MLSSADALTSLQSAVDAVGEEDAGRRVLQQGRDLGEEFRHHERRTPHGRRQVLLPKSSEGIVFVRGTGSNNPVGVIAKSDECGEQNRTGLKVLARRASASESDSRLAISRR